jgi:hypothetical protein
VSDTTFELEVDDDGIVFVVTRTREAIGHVADPATSYLVPDELADDFEAEREAWEDGQRAAAGVREAGAMAFERAVGRVTG